MKCSNDVSSFTQQRYLPSKTAYILLKYYDSGLGKTFDAVIAQVENMKLKNSKLKSLILNPLFQVTNDLDVMKSTFTKCVTAYYDKLYLGTVTVDKSNQ